MMKNAMSTQSIFGLFSGTQLFLDLSFFPLSQEGRERKHTVEFIKLHWQKNSKSFTAFPSWSQMGLRYLGDLIMCSSASGTFAKQTLLGNHVIGTKKLDPHSFIVPQCAAAIYPYTPRAKYSTKGVYTTVSTTHPHTVEIACKEVTSYFPPNCCSLHHSNPWSSNSICWSRTVFRNGHTLLEGG